MYTILVFGLKERLPEISAGFADRPTRILPVRSPGEFSSTAFSRMFDLWIIDCRLPDAARLSLANPFTGGTVPFMFMIKPEDDESLPVTRVNPSIMMVNDDVSAASWARTFFDMSDERQAENRNRYLAGFLRSCPGIEALISDSPLIHRLTDLVKDVAPTDSALLLHGETGTGKELVATILHNESRRREGPFMAVNCGALPDTLLESELFGYEKGSFTGATGRRIGKIEHAAGGTLFLDEIEAMSAAMQVRLLRVLQEKSLQRLGSNIEIATDFRLIAATNSEPARLLDSGILRSDLYYRIAVFPIHIPPLRDRREDIPLLVTHFISRKKKDGRTYIEGLEPAAMKLLVDAPWPGNIRELQNVIERSVVLAYRATIGAEAVDIPTAGHSGPSGPGAPADGHAFAPGTTLKSYKTKISRAAERCYLTELLQHAGGRIGEAADLAGLTPRALHNKMKYHGLNKENFKIRPGRGTSVSKKPTAG